MKSCKKGRCPSSHRSRCSEARTARTRPVLAKRHRSRVAMPENSGHRSDRRRAWEPDEPAQLLAGRLAGRERVWPQLCLAAWRRAKQFQSSRRVPSVLILRLHLSLSLCIYISQSHHHHRRTTTRSTREQRTRGMLTLTRSLAYTVYTHIQRPSAATSPRMSTCTERYRRCSPSVFPPAEFSWTSQLTVQYQPNIPTCT